MYSASFFTIESHCSLFGNLAWNTPLARPGLLLPPVWSSSSDKTSIPAPSLSLTLFHGDVVRVLALSFSALAVPGLFPASRRPTRSCTNACRPIVNHAHSVGYLFVADRACALASAISCAFSHGSTCVCDCVGGLPGYPHGRHDSSRSECIPLLPHGKIVVEGDSAAHLDRWPLTAASMGPRQSPAAPRREVDKDDEGQQPRRTPPPAEHHSQMMEGGTRFSTGTDHPGADPSSPEDTKCPRRTPRGLIFSRLFATGQMLTSTSFVIMFEYS